MLGLVLATVVPSCFGYAVSGQGSWETTLLGRDFNGNTATGETYYDTELDITWLADVTVRGTVNWPAAKAWTAAVGVNGTTGWRLPSLRPIDGAAFNTDFSNNATTDVGYAPPTGWIDSAGAPTSELGHMFYATLGNRGLCAPNNVQPGSCGGLPGQPVAGLTNTGPFLNTGTSGIYYADLAYVTNPATQAWGLNTLGLQGNFGQSALLYAWAVHDGDVGAAVVPAPSCHLVVRSLRAGSHTATATQAGRAVPGASPLTSQRALNCHDGSRHSRLQVHQGFRHACIAQQICQRVLLHLVKKRALRFREHMIQIAR